MNIGDKYKIESDSMNITLFRRHTVKATPKKPVHEIWKVEGYFRNVRNALKTMADLHIAKSGMKDFETVVEKQQEIYNLIRGLNVQ